jgi:aminopeptidase-like protein
LKISEKILNDDSIGAEMFNLIKELFPICRSITGNGTRKTLDIIRTHIPLEIKEIPSNTNVFDWTVPKEWNIINAYVKNSKGEKIIDFQKSNLHILQYSIPIHKKMTLDELKTHLYSIEEYPDWIPYRTSYYQENWGFCISHKQFQTLDDDEYEVFIDSTLENGSLTYGELFFKGEIEDEILFSTYICHPSMCNDNLSGVSLLTFLAKTLIDRKTKYSYRFLFIPETIGAISWLSKNENDVHKIKYGVVATCVGDSGQLTYKKTKQGNTLLDKIVEKILVDSRDPYEIVDFFPTGSDERQFSSPGFNIPVGSLVRTLYGKFTEYHTSADNMDFMNSKSLQDSFAKYHSIIYVLENNMIYKNQNPKCEPNLGKRKLYDLIGANKELSSNSNSIFWLLNQSDGNISLLEIATKSNIPFIDIKNMADILVSHDLLTIMN